MLDNHFCCFWKRRAKNLPFSSLHETNFGPYDSPSCQLQCVEFQHLDFFFWNDFSILCACGFIKSTRLFIEHHKHSPGYLLCLQANYICFEIVRISVAWKDRLWALVAVCWMNLFLLSFLFLSPCPTEEPSVSFFSHPTNDSLWILIRIKQTNKQTNTRAQNILWTP